MKNILETIVADKLRAVQELKEIKPVKLLERSLFFEVTPLSLSDYLKREDRVGIIAEVKRKSPSRGVINTNFDVEKLSISYMQAGASALSVLTDLKYFGGKNIDLEVARKFNYCPILRKDFILDEYQIIEAKSIGADCILLIAACLSPEQCKTLAAFAKSLKLEVLLEVRTKEEVDSYCNPYIDLIGVNNRDLKNFKTDLEHSKMLYEFLPKELVKISESGITTASDIKALKDLGYNGFLIGGYFMQHEEPGKTCKHLIDECNLLGL